MTVTIGKATPSVTAPTAKTGLTYNGSAQELVTAGSATGGEMQYSTDGTTYSTTVPTGTDANTYTVYYKVVGDGNYSDVAAASPVTVTIDKATPSVTAPTANTLTYSGSAQELVTAGSASGGELKYSTDGTNYSSDIPKGTDAGTYTVYYKVVGDSNHNDVAAASVQVTIAQQTYTVTVETNGHGTAEASQTSAAVGTEITLTATANSGYRFKEWQVVSGSVIVTSNKFTMPAAHVTVKAIFEYVGGGSSGGGSYTPPTYPPTVEKPSEGGTVTVNPSRPSTGDKVTVRPKPDSGYEVEEVTITDRSGKPVTVTKNPDGTYTFTQPNGTVKVKVSYKPIKTPWSNPFEDVDETAWYYDAVRYVSENGLMNGYDNGRFGPNDNLSRAQLAQILFNKEGRPGVNYLTDFSDVTGEAWYAEAVRWAAAMGIVGGYGNGLFGPNDNITREQLAVMLWRYSGSPAATNKELHFNDTDEISGYALEAMRWAVENGILNGYGDGWLGPNGLATRAQVAQMLKNYMSNT